MIKKIIILLITVVLFITIFIFLNNNSSEIELTYQIKDNSYKWEYEIEDENIVQFVKKYNISDNEINYVFKGIKKGKTTVNFKYINSSTNEIIKEENITLKVDSSKKISLVANLD